MKTISYSNLTKKIAGLRGQASLSAADQILARLFIQARAKMGWEFFPWPDVCDVQERFKLPFYEDGQSYAAASQRLFAETGRCYVAAVAAGIGVDPTDEEVWAPLRRSYDAPWFNPLATYLPGNFVRAAAAPRRTYFCIQNTGTVIGASPDTLPDFWFLLPEWTPEFSLAADADLDLVEMGSVLRVTGSDPREIAHNFHWCNYEFSLNSRGVLLLRVGREQGMAWFYYRKPVPSWDGAIYTTGTYALGDQVYYTPQSDFFKSLVADNTDAPTVAASWERIEFPAFLADFTALSVQADLLAGPDGQMEKFPIEDAAGFAYLKREIDLVVRQQHQSKPMNVLTR